MIKKKKEISLTGFKEKRIFLCPPHVCIKMTGQSDYEDVILPQEIKNFK